MNDGPLIVGTTVEYHGSIPEAYGNYVVIGYQPDWAKSSSDGYRYHLSKGDGKEAVLTNANRQSLTPTSLSQRIGLVHGE